MIKCEICNKTFKSIRGLSYHLKKNGICIEDYYNYILHPNELNGFCEQCGKETKFKSLSEGYERYCGNPCPTRDFVVSKSRQTMLKKYGKEHALQIKEFKDKLEKTSLERYGYKSPMSNEKIKDKQKETFQKKFGCNTPLQNKEIKNKLIQTNIKKYGVKWITQSEDIKIKLSESWKNKSEIIKQEIITKRKNTCLSKYGVDVPTKSKNIINKREETFIKKFGVKNPMQLDIIKEKLSKIQLKKNLPNLKKQWEYLDIELIDTEFLGSHIKHNWRCKKCGLKFKQIWNSIQQGYLCPRCYPRGSCGFSKLEIEVRDFLSGIGIEFKYNTKEIINPLELDIYCFNNNIAIELDGLYWHSDSILTDKNYHLNKTLKCEEKGIRLIHIFEDEWILKKDIVKTRLKHILHKTENCIHIGARKCCIKEIPTNIKNDFLLKYHIQGSDNSIVKLGAFYNDELVAVMTFNHGSLAKGIKNSDPFIWELNRFCTNPNYVIAGIAGKLLSYFKKNYEWKEIFSYADRRWSNGKVYINIGFVLDSYTQPNYWYVKGINRIHRFNLRKKAHEPKDIPEHILRSKEGYIRVWDCGNMKFKLTKK